MSSLQNPNNKQYICNPQYSQKEITMTNKELLKNNKRLINKDNSELKIITFMEILEEKINKKKYLVY